MHQGDRVRPMRERELASFCRKEKAKFEEVLKHSSLICQIAWKGVIRPAHTNVIIWYTITLRPVVPRLKWSLVRQLLVACNSNTTPVVGPRPNTETYGRFYSDPPPAPGELIFLLLRSSCPGTNSVPQFCKS